MVMIIGGESEALGKRLTVDEWWTRAAWRDSGLGNTYQGCGPVLPLNRTPNCPHLAEQPPLKPSTPELRFHQVTSAPALTSAVAPSTMGYSEDFSKVLGILGGFISPHPQLFYFLYLNCLLHNEGSGLTLPSQAKCSVFTQPGRWYVDIQTGVGQLRKASWALMSLRRP